MSLSLNFPTIVPSLNLDFASSTGLDPRITFTRASTARYYNGVTTAKAEENLFQESQTLGQPFWAVARTSVTLNTSVAPDGTTTAETLTADGTSGSHFLQSTDASTPAGQTRTLSVFAKAGTNNFVQLAFGGDATPYANFDLSGGTVGNSASVTASIVSFGNGWYRCVATTTSTAASGGRFFIVTDGTSVRGESNSLSTTVLLWGAQMEFRSAATAYTPTTTQPITNYVPVLLTAPVGVARLDHNPTTGESLGLLIEEQRTNLQIQSEDFTTSWATAAASIQSNTLVAPSGALTADKLVEDGTNAWHYVAYFSITPTTATPYTLSCYAKKGEREFVQLYLPSTAFGDSNSANGAVFNLTTGTISVQGASLTSASITSVGNGWYRCAITKTSTSTTAFPFVVTVRDAGTFSISGYTGNGYSGIYIWGAQLEAGAFPTSYIPTVAATVTRNADVASMTGTNFSSWYNATEGTLYSEASTYDVGAARATFYINDGSTSNRIQTNNGSGAKVFIATNGTTELQQTNFTGVTYANNVFAKVGLAYKQNDGIGAVNGVIGTLDTVLTVPVVNEVKFGQISTINAVLNGHIRRIAYYPVRLSDAQLQALTR